MYYVYILTNTTKTVLYTGVTNNLTQRIIEHFMNRGDQHTFTGRYACHNLVYYEEFKYINNAIVREKAIKNWPRKWKEELIAKENPEWIFLNDTLFDKWPPIENDLYSLPNRE